MRQKMAKDDIQQGMPSKYPAACSKYNSGHSKIRMDAMGTSQPSKGADHAHRGSETFLKEAADDIHSAVTEHMEAQGAGKEEIASAQQRMMAERDLGSKCLPGIYRLDTRP
jgi:uncharacterized RmlC-like cupin family protein